MLYMSVPICISFKQNPPVLDHSKDTLSNETIKCSQLPVLKITVNGSAHNGPFLVDIFQSTVVGGPIVECVNSSCEENSIYG